MLYEVFLQLAVLCQIASFAWIFMFKLANAHIWKHAAVTLSELIQPAFDLRVLLYYHVR